MHLSIAHSRVAVPLYAVVCLIVLASCESPQPVERAVPLPPVRNDILLLPGANQTSAEVVPNHMLGDPKLPGGTIGSYVVKGAKYRLFIVRAETSQGAALLLLNMKNAMPDAAYVAHMGGYSGTYNGAPLYAFAKLQFLAGVVGLPNSEADTVARQLAARLR